MLLEIAEIRLLAAANLLLYLISHWPELREMLDGFSSSSEKKRMRAEYARSQLAFWFYFAFSVVLLTFGNVNTVAGIEASVDTALVLGLVLAIFSFLSDLRAIGERAPQGDWGFVTAKAASYPFIVLTLMLFPYFIISMFDTVTSVFSLLSSLLGIAGVDIPPEELIGIVFGLFLRLGLLLVALFVGLGLLLQIKRKLFG